MPSSKQYLVDANVFIEAANTYYALDRVPGFWAWMKDAAQAGSVKTIQFVLDEIEHPEGLVDWVSGIGADVLTVDPSEPAVQAEYQKIVNWLVAQDFGQEHVAKFLDKADPWLIAVAKVQGRTLVTQETLAGAGTKKVKVPNVCAAHGVEWANTFTMLDDLGASF